ncbi:MAG: zinc ribbon domain-containing protein [Promethearchaeota archaeon]
MEIETEQLLNLANKRYSEIFKDGFKLFRQTYGTLILPLALFQLVLIIINILLLTDFLVFINSLAPTYDSIMNKYLGGFTLTEAEWSFLSTFLLLDWIYLFLQNLIGAIIITIAMSSVSSYVYKKYLREDVNFIESFKSSFNKKMFLAVLIIGFCLPVGSLLLFVPAIFIFGFFIFIVFTFNMESNNNPISEARAVSKGNFWKILGVFVLNFIIISFIGSVFEMLFNTLLNTSSPIFIANFNSWYDPASRNYGMIILYQILMSFVEILFAPLFICLLTVLFSSLKAKRDLTQGDYFIRKSYEQIPTQKLDKMENYEPLSKTQLKDKFYCPFCGHFVSTPKKFCPKCGESLDFLSG